MNQPPAASSEGSTPGAQHLIAASGPALGTQQSLFTTMSALVTALSGGIPLEPRAGPASLRRRRAAQRNATDGRGLSPEVLAVIDAAADKSDQAWVRALAAAGLLRYELL